MFGKKKEKELNEFVRVVTDELGEIHSISSFHDFNTPVSERPETKIFRAEDIELPKDLPISHIRTLAFNEWTPIDINILFLRIRNIPSHILTDQRKVVKKEKRVTLKHHLNFIV